MNADILLRVANLSKSYDGVHALKNACFELHAGEVHALVGENGAGKSTLIKAITGAVQPEHGQIFLDGQSIDHNSPRLAKSLGIAAIYQQPALFPELSVAENIALGFESSNWKIVDWNARKRRASELLRQLGANIDLDGEAGELTVAQQQLVEIARALGAKARVLIMDEPTASLSEQDTRNLFGAICQLRGQGVGIVYISHRLEELFVIADRVTILRDGSTIATRSMSDVSRDELVRLMVGRELSAIFPRRVVNHGSVVLELRNVTCNAVGIRNVSLSVRAGEIVSLTGLVGAGRTELARILFGLTPPDEGNIVLHGSATRLSSPSHAIRSGIAYVPEDRRRHGVIPQMGVAANISLASLDKISGFGRMDFAREKSIAADYVCRLQIKTPSIFSPVTSLSGGNQQKVALSRWLATQPSLLILDEPTQGIDVHAKSEIYRLMAELASQGLAIVMISSELPEVIGMSDRIIVMRAGTVAGILDRLEATQEKILSLALGHVAATEAAVTQ